MSYLEGHRMPAKRKLRLKEKPMYPTKIYEFIATGDSHFPYPLCIVCSEQHGKKVLCIKRQALGYFLLPPKNGNTYEIRHNEGVPLQQLCLH